MMKFKEYLSEAKEVNLIGMTINFNLVTAETQNKKWKRLFDCSNRKLTSLTGAPLEVENDFQCDRNKITSLIGAPVKVGGDFSCANNRLTSLEGAPKEVGGHFYCHDNQITSLKDIHKQIIKMNGGFHCHHNEIKSHVLGLLLIPGIKVIASAEKWGPILNDYIGSGRKGLLDCQNELIEAGLEEFAQL